MTGPNEPTPGAPATAPNPQAPPTPAAPPATPPAQAAEDVASLPDWAQKMIRDTRAEAAKARTDAKAAAAADARKAVLDEFAQKLGFAGDNPPDPAELASQAGAAREAAWSYAVELEVIRATGDPGAAAKLLDSVSFLDSLDEMVDLNPSSTEFKDGLKTKVQEALAKLPAPPAGQAPNGPRPDPTQGTRGTPPANRPTSLTQALNAHYAAKAAGRR